MRAKRRAALWLAALILALAACYALLSWEAPAQQAPAQIETWAVTSLPVADVAAISIQNERAAYAIMQAGGAFEVISDVQGAYDAAQLRALFYAACNITGENRVTDRAAFADYGFDTPSAAVQLILTDGGRRTLSLLARDPLKGGYYLYDGQTDAVYAVGAALGELFARAPLDFFSHTFFPLETDADLDGVTRVSVEPGDDQGYEVTWENGSCRLVRPIACRLSATLTRENLLLPLAALYADAVEAAGANLTEYGFTDQSPRLTVTCGDRDYTAVFARGNAGRRLMADPQTGTVWGFDEDPLPALTRDYTYLLGGRALTYAAGDLSGATLTRDNAVYAVTFSAQGGQLSAARDGVPIDAAAFVAALNGLTIAGRADAMPEGMPAAAELRVSFRSGGEERAVFTDAGNGLYALTVDGQTNFAVSARDARALFGQFENPTVFTAAD